MVSCFVSVVLYCVAWGWVVLCCRCRESGTRLDFRHIPSFDTRTSTRRLGFSRRGVCVELRAEGTDFIYFSSWSCDSVLHHTFWHHVRHGYIFILLWAGINEAPFNPSVATRSPADRKSQKTVGPLGDRQTPTGMFREDSSLSHILWCFCVQRWSTSYVTAAVVHISSVISYYIRLSSAASWVQRWGRGDSS